MQPELEETTLTIESWKNLSGFLFQMARFRRHKVEYLLIKLHKVNNSGFLSYLLKPFNEIARIRWSSRICRTRLFSLNLSVNRNTGPKVSTERESLRGTSFQLGRTEREQSKVHGRGRISIVQKVGGLPHHRDGLSWAHHTYSIPLPCLSFTSIVISVQGPDQSHQQSRI